ncbi:MAG: hypothetical protein AAFY72_05690, partial [Cyanobacteria bacterium J06649_4]
NLDWQAIAGLTTTEPLSKVSDTQTGNAQTDETLPTQPAAQKNDEIDTLVQQLRKTAKASLHERCGTMRVLDMSHPVGLSNIYTSVNIFETVSSHQRKQLKDLIAAVETDVETSDFDRLGFGPVSQP